MKEDGSEGRKEKVVRAKQALKRRRRIILE